MTRSDSELRKTLFANIVAVLGKMMQQDSAWVDMRLHESHDEGGFGVPNC